MSRPEDSPDLAVASLKLWGAVKEFGRAVTKETEEAWHGATEPRRPSGANPNYVMVPRGLWEDVVEALDDPTVGRLLPVAIVSPLGAIRNVVDDRDR